MEHDCHQKGILPHDHRTVLDHNVLLYTDYRPENFKSGMLQSIIVSSTSNLKRQCLSVVVRFSNNFRVLVHSRIIKGMLDASTMKFTCWLIQTCIPYNVQDVSYPTQI